ncbi:MAG TPA: glycosyltransferase, partial [Anaerolineae bacterium]
MKLSSVTAFFPCYNDAGTIPTMILRALQTLPQVTSDYEVVVINDGSRDDSARILEEMACAFPQLRVIHRDRP